MTVGIQVSVVALVAIMVTIGGCGGGDGTAKAATPTDSGVAIDALTLGPPWVVSFDKYGQAWTALRSYQPGRDGGGVFMQFQSYNKAGQVVTGVTFNPGLIDATPGHEQGDFDVALLIDGKSEVIALTGAWGGQPPGIMFSTPNLFWLGGSAAPAAGANLTQHPCPGTVPGAPAHCVTVNGGSVPVYR